MRFQNVCCMLILLSFSVVALRVELSATRLSAEFGQPALDYRAVSLAVLLSRSGRHALRHRWHGGRPDTHRLHSGLCHPRPTSVSFQSGRQDSNLRSCVPKTHGFAATLHPATSFISFFYSSQNGRIRTGGLQVPDLARYPGFATFCSSFACRPQQPIRELNPSFRLERTMSSNR